MHQDSGLSPHQFNIYRRFLGRSLHTMACDIIHITMVFSYTSPSQMEQMMLFRWLSSAWRLWRPAYEGTNYDSTLERQSGFEFKLRMINLETFKLNRNSNWTGNFTFIGLSRDQRHIGMMCIYLCITFGYIL